MPDEGFKIENLHFGTMNGGALVPIGEVVEPVSISVDDDMDSSQSYFRELTADSSGTISLKIPWWLLNRVARMLGCRAPYLVARLRRGGKSHRGKARSICHAT